MKAFYLMVYFEPKRVTLRCGNVGGFNEEEEGDHHDNYLLFLDMKASSSFELERIVFQLSLWIFKSFYLRLWSDEEKEFKIEKESKTHSNLFQILRKFEFMTWAISRYVPYSFINSDGVGYTAVERGEYAREEGWWVGVVERRPRGGEGGEGCWGGGRWGWGGGRGGRREGVGGGFGNGVSKRAIEWVGWGRE